MPSIALAQLERHEEAHQVWKRAEALFAEQEQQPDDSLAESREEARLAMRPVRNRRWRNDNRVTKKPAS